MSAENQKTILLVDDEAITGETIKRTLEKCGYKIITANTGEEAVEIFKKTPEIDLILMDINLGTGMDGTEAAAIILRQRDLPVVFLSSHIEPEVVEKTEKIASYGYVVKNSSSTVLDASIKMAFKLFEAKIKEKEKESQKEAALEALQQNIQKWEAIITASPDGIGMISLDGKLQVMSDKLLIMHGYEYSVEQKNEFMGKSVFDFIDPSSHKMLIDNIRKLLSGKKDFNISEYLAVKKDNSKFYDEVSSTVLFDSKGNPESILFVERDITERKRTEDALRESEGKFRTLVENNHDIIFMLSIDGVFTFVSPAWNKLLGHSVTQVVGQPFQLFIHPDDVADCMVWLQKMAETGKRLENIEVRVRHTDGSWHWFYTSGVPLQDEAGTIVGFEGTASDITKRKQAEKLTEALYKISQAIYTTGNLYELFEHIHRALSGIIPTDNLFIALLSENGKVLTFPYNIDEKDTDIAPVIEVDNLQSLTVEVLKTKKPLLLDETELHDRYATGRNKVWGSEPKCWLGVPLMIRDTAIGVMAVQDYHKHDAYSQKDVTLLELAAGQIAIAIERKRASDVLRESQLRLEAQYQGMPIPTFIWQKQGEDFELIDYNDAAKVITHDKVIGFVGRKASDLYANRQDILQDLRQCFVEKKVIRKETKSEHFVPGKLIVLTVVSIPADLIMVHMEDITERKRAEKLTEALYKISQAIYATSNLNELFEHVHRALSGMIPTKNLFIALISNDGKVLNFPYDIDEKDTDITPVIEVNNLQSLTVEVLRTKRPLLLDETELHDRYATGRNRVWGTAPKCWLGVPLIIRDTVIGVMAVQDYYKQGAYNQKDVTLLELAAGQIAIAIERKRAEEEIKRQLTEKEILLREVHHRIKNNIASIGALISLHLKSIRNPEAIAVLQDAIGRVNSMGILYEKLLVSEGYKEVSVKNYVESLADTVIELFPDTAKVKLDKHIVDFHLDAKRLFPLGIIINEILTNKMKYAFINKKDGFIKISLANIDGHITLTILDNGNELPDGFDVNESKRFGLTLVKMLSQQLAGSFSIEKHAGTQCKIEFNI